MQFKSEGLFPPFLFTKIVFTRYLLLRKDERKKMELSPKQQAVEKIKSSERILILGHKKPMADQLGSLLALNSALTKLDKKVEVIVSDNTPEKYNFLPGIKDIKNKLEIIDGKVIKVDINKIPVSGMKWKKDDDYLSIILDTDKNIKFEHIEIVNGNPKPDLIIIVDTKKTSEIDSAYNKDAEIFIEVPIINIDHHSGNEHFGTVNLVDLTATSTSEILVSLFESLGVKIDNPQIATNLLVGITEDTNSFQNNSTTPKSLTVAAQLLAAGAKQQEIVSNIFELQTSNNDLMRLWNNLVDNTQFDSDHSFAWTKVEGNKENVFEAALELLEKIENSNTLLAICGDNNKIYGKIVGDNETEMSKAFEKSEDETTEFIIDAENINEAEKIALKNIYDFWQGSEETKTEGKEVWEALDGEPQNIDYKPTDEDAIEEALRSIEQSQDEQEKTKELTSIREVIDRKKQTLDPREEIDVFEEQEE